MSAVPLKIHYGQTIRRAQLSSNHKMNDLIDTVHNLFPEMVEKSSYTLTYVDEDSDTITLSSDNELIAAIHLVKSMGWGKLHINIVCDGSGDDGTKKEVHVVKDAKIDNALPVVVEKNNCVKKKDFGFVPSAKTYVDAKNRKNVVVVDGGEENTEEEKSKTTPLADDPVKEALQSLGFDPEKSKVDVQIEHGNTVNLFNGQKKTTEPDESKKNSTKVSSSKAPLTATSGGPLIYPDGTVEFGMGGEAVLLPDGKTVSCVLSYTGFPSVAASNTVLTEGKWYYEVILLTDGLMQIGWCDTKFEGNSNGGKGVGDDEHSIAYDGYRKLKWHNGRSTPFGKRWKAGDVVCCAADLENGIIKFALNGDWKGDRVVAFNSLVFHDGLIPAASFSKGEKLCFNFGADAFVHAPPTLDYLPVHIAVGNKNIFLQQQEKMKKNAPQATFKKEKVPSGTFQKIASAPPPPLPSQQQQPPPSYGGRGPPPLPSASFVNNPFTIPSQTSSFDNKATSDPISPTEHLAALLLQDDVRDAIGRFLANPEVALALQHIIVAALAGSKDAMNAQFGNIIPLLIQLASEAPALLAVLPMIMDPTNFMGTFGCFGNGPPPLCPRRGHHGPPPHPHHQPCYDYHPYGSGQFPAPPNGHEWDGGRQRGGGWRNGCERKNWRKQQRQERRANRQERRQNCNRWGGGSGKCGPPRSAFQQGKRKEDESTVGTLGRMVNNVLNATGVNNVLESMVPADNNNEKQFSSDLQKAITASLKETQQKQTACDVARHKASAALAAAMAVKGKNVVVQVPPQTQAKPATAVVVPSPKKNTSANNSPSLTPQHLRPRAKFVEQFAVEADSLDNSKHVALTSLLPGEKVRHTWKIVNPSDTITWPVGVVAKSVGGDDFVISTKKWKPYNPLKPKEVVEIVVEATAPTKPGRYIHYWRLHEENGAPFGDRIWLDMTVVLSRKMVTSKVVKKVVSIPSPIIEKKTVGGKENEKVIVTPISAKPKEEVIVVGRTNEPEAAGCEDKKIAAVQVEKKKTMEDSTNTNVLDEKEGENTAVLSPDDRDLPNIEKELSDAVSTASTTQSLSNPDQEWDMLHTGSFDDNMVTAESMIRLEKYKSELDTLSSMGFSDRDLLIQLLDEHNGDTQKVITSFLAKK